MRRHDGLPYWLWLTRPDASLRNPLTMQRYPLRGSQPPGTSRYSAPPRHLATDNYLFQLLFWTLFLTHLLEAASDSNVLVSTTENMQALYNLHLHN